MDSNLIYMKTAAGEEAIQQKARVMQRNLRMVLILVDGKSTVADLSLKIGNALLTETALTELESAGFVAPRIEQDSSWFEGKRIKRTTKKARADGEHNPQSRSRDSIFGTERDLDSVHSAFDDSMFGNSKMSLPGTALDERAEPQTGKARETSRDGQVAAWWARSRAWIAGLFTRPEGEERQISVKIKPIQRERKPRRASWPVRVLLSVLGLVAIVIVAALFFPYDYLRPDVEAALTRSFGMPVTVRTVRAEVYPQLGFHLEGVRLVKDSNVLDIPSLRVLPAAETLFDERWALQRVVVTGVSLPVQAVALLPTVFTNLAGPDSRMLVKNVAFDETRLSFGGLSLVKLSGDVKLDPAGLFQSLALHTGDGSLALQIHPDGRGVRVDAEGLGWQPDDKSPFRFESLNVRSKVENAGMAIESLDLRVLGGVVKGSAVVGAEKNPSLQGDITFERIDAKRLFGALGIADVLAGEVSGRFSFAADSKDWASLIEALTVDGDISVGRGKLIGFDLPEAVRRHSATPVQGGETPFERLSAKVRGTPSSVVLSAITVSSGLMESAGKVEVKKDMSIDGSVQLVMRGSVNKLRVPVAVNGTLSVPNVRVESR